MPVVSNPSPISNLAVIGKLDLLRDQFAKILIPGAVDRELKALSNPRAKAAIEAALADGWIEIRPVESQHLSKLLSVRLHDGESEAIAREVETNASWILLDEWEARAAAQRMNLKITGILGVLLRAKKKGDIVLPEPVMKQLRREAHFFIAPALERHLLELAGE